MSHHRSSGAGFSLLEIIVVTAIIGVIASIILVALSGVRAKGRDAKRKIEIAQIGRFMSGASCFMPQSGAGEYDLVPLASELAARYPQYAQYVSNVPRDPSVGTEIESYYRYMVSEDGLKCALWANLENADEPVTNFRISAPTAGGGTGVFEGGVEGWNGTTKYYQVSN